MTEDRARLNALPAAYPRLFPKGPLHWGFELGDGWSQVVALLCERLDTILQEAPGASIEVLQVKEKFGGLRFYYSRHGVSDEMATALRDAVELAATASLQICERCGHRGEMQDKAGWLRVVCSVCRIDP